MDSTEAGEIARAQDRRSLSSIAKLACTDLEVFLQRAITELVDDHHDQYSAPTAWQSIHVRGVDLEDVDALEIAMELPGVCFGILPEAGGFVIVRKAE